MLSHNAIRLPALSLFALALLEGCTTAPTQRQLQQAVAVLEQRGDPDSLATAAVLLPFTQRPSNAAAQILLVRAVAAAPERADLAWLQIQNCRLAPGCDSEPEERRLRALDTANGAAWINALTRANQSGDEAARIAALSGLARSERVDVYYTTLTAHLTRALAHTHEISLPDALNEVMGATSAEAIPAYGATSALCKGDRLNDAAIVEDCRRVASAMQRGDTYIAEELGVAIAKRVWPVDSPEWKAAVEERRVFEYRGQLSAHSDLVSMRDSRSAERYLDLCAQNRREQDMWLAEFIHEGKSPDPPPDWVPRTPAQ
jgi:hypothetical protein